MNHSIACEYPEGCSCGASQFNAMEFKRNSLLMKTTEIPAILDEAKDAGCKNDGEIIGYMATEISRLRGLLIELKTLNSTAEVLNPSLTMIRTEQIVSSAF